MIKLLKRKAKRAFTLIELVVVIAVIAILAGVSVAAYFGVTESAKNSAAEQEATQLVTLVGVVATDGETFDADEEKYKLTYSSSGLKIEATTNNLDHNDVVTVFDYIYFKGSEGEYTDEDNRFDGTHASLTVYGKVDDSNLKIATITGFNYTLTSGGSNTTGLSASFTEANKGNPILAKAA